MDEIENAIRRTVEVYRRSWSAATPGYIPPNEVRNMDDLEHLLRIIDELRAEKESGTSPPKLDGGINVGDRLLLWDRKDVSKSVRVSDVACEQGRVVLTLTDSKGTCWTLREEDVRSRCTRYPLE